MVEDGKRVIGITTRIQVFPYNLLETKKSKIGQLFGMFGIFAPESESSIANSSKFTVVSEFSYILSLVSILNVMISWCLQYDDIG